MMDATSDNASFPCSPPALKREITRSHNQEPLAVLPLRRTDSVAADTVTITCQLCPDQFEVPASELSWRSVCTACYSANAKKCIVCNERNIKIGAAKWVTTCTTCWLGKRMETHATCPMCPPARSLLLRRLKSRPMCNDCLRESKKK